MAGIFFSYRRTSVPLVTQIYERFRDAFPNVEIFLDWPSIKPGAKFPDAIGQALSSSQIVLVMIDPTWISVQDKSFRRRLDMPSDWVRKEVAGSLKEGKLVIPVLIAGARMPKRDQLPGPLQNLAKCNAKAIHDEYFAEDVNKLIDHIRSEIVERELRDYDTPSSPYPKPRALRPAAIEGAELARLFEDLPRWREVRSLIEEEVGAEGPAARVEMKRTFKFPSFRDAIRFMNKASKRIDPYDHHPRWENIYDRVTVGLSTWDSGHIITDRDYKTALMLEGLYRDFLAGR